jgi:hypothetical protein
VIFAVVELTRSLQNRRQAVITGTPVTFDPICVNSTSDTKTLVVSGSFLNGKRVLVGPLKGFSFSFSQDSTYSDSLKIRDYGASFSKTLYVKFNPEEAGSFDGLIPMRGGGAGRFYASVTASALPAVTLNADVKNITCYNARNGSIALTATGGTAPISFRWTSTDGYKSNLEDISSLKPSTYTVTVNSGGGCSTNASYVISQPDVLQVNLAADPMTCRGGTTTLHVNATGGTQPYTGTGDFTVNSGWKTYTITDVNGCSGHAGLTVTNGSLTAPIKPASVTGANADATGLCGGGDFNYSVSKVADATSYSWTPPAGCTVSNANSDGSNVILHAPANFNSGVLTVKAMNACGSSNPQSKSLIDIPAKPGAVSGPSSVKANQTSLKYSVPFMAGVKYVWTVPARATITAGQNTSTIIVTWGTTAGNVAVSTVNDCGSSTYKSGMYVNMAAGFELRSLSDQQAQTPEVTLHGTTIYPNPAKDVATLWFNSSKQFSISVQIFDMAGKRVMEKTGIAQQGSNNVTLNVSALARGTYMVTFKNAEGKLRTLKLVKE